MFISPALIQSALELGIIYALIALALFLTYSMLNVCDLSTDGCYVLGAAVGAILAIDGHPFLALILAPCAGILSGLVNAFLQTKMKVESMLAGIIVNTGLYTINILVMGKSTLSMNTTTTVFTMMKDVLKGTALESYSKLVVAVLFTLVAVILLLLFLGTRLGLSIRATGDNIAMVKSSSINPVFTTTIGLCIGGAMTALAGCLLGEYQKSVDINMGTGMVTVVLASLIIGETLFSRKNVKVRAFGVILGSCLYRVIVAVALRFNLPASALKLVSAIIVGLAISMPAIKELIMLRKTKIVAMKKHKELVAKREGK
ncbi:hypothetical protein P261_01580 [Lachnospiraceae bacterium TWA4]|nr:hypothetical protein P261_01580 [Lachnospiraceae bacterium TWA4]